MNCQALVPILVLQDPITIPIPNPKKIPSPKVHLGMGLTLTLKSHGPPPLLSMDTIICL